MRVKRSKDDLTVFAAAGSNVVTLGINMPRAKMKGVLGFAVRRSDHSDGNLNWMKGMKTFEATDPKLGPGGQVSSREHPFQTFQWSDYSAQPEETYTYRVVAIRGKPEKVEEAEALDVKVTAESEQTGKHAVYFNRGAVASQEYARRFQNMKPSKVGEPAFKWLSRGLVEALLEFIGQADGSKHGLYGAIFQFQNPDVFAALKKAKGSGADVRVLYDGKDQKTQNEEALESSGIKSFCEPRTNSGKYAHNKFFVLTKNKNPVAVWTGSTNLTSNGIYGHSNCGHVVRDAKVARAYLEYWEQLKNDEKKADLGPWTVEHSPAPLDPWEVETVPVFSPRKGIAALDWYAEIAGSAKRALMMTFAFGMNKRFVDAYNHKDDVLRYALMETGGMNDAQKAQVQAVRRLPNCVVAIGKNVTINAFDRWLKEISTIEGGTHVKYVHTKYMLVDPLGEKPIVVTGLANFSDASTDTNDENMLVIRGNKAVADIYFGEFMRLHSHYAFRESLSFRKESELAKPRFLEPSSDWINEGYFEPGQDRHLRRLYFSGN